MPVEVLPGPVVPHGRPWVCVPGCYLDVTEVDAGIKHRRHEGVPKHVRMHPRAGHSGSLSQCTEAAGRTVPIHPASSPAPQDRAASASVDRPVERPAHCRRQRNKRDLVAFALDSQDAVTVDLLQCLDVGAGGLEDTQPEKPEKGDEGEVIDVRRIATRAQHGPELQMVQPKRGRFSRDSWPPDVVGRRVLEDAVDDARPIANAIRPAAMRRSGLPRRRTATHCDPRRRSLTGALVGAPQPSTMIRIPTAQADEIATPSASTISLSLGRGVVTSAQCCRDGVRLRKLPPYRRAKMPVRSHGG